VTKKEIVKTISEELGLTQLKTKEIVQKTFDAIVEALVEEGRIELRNFGVFEVKKRASRKARNPRTGQRVDVPEKWVVTFKPGKEMEERVRVLAEERERRQEAATSMQQTGFGTTGGLAPPYETRVEPLGHAGEPGTETRPAPAESSAGAVSAEGTGSGAGFGPSP
jgi:nucleoid DNA-binding protein